MIWQPLLITVQILDVLGLLFVAAAAVGSLRILLGWDGTAATRKQLALERKAESASLQGRCGACLFIGGSILLIIGISAVLPERVPGAMCGMGVLQATGAQGAKALILRGLGTALLAAGLLMERLNRSSPEAPLTPACQRTWLLGTPVVLLAVAGTLRAILALDVEQPVDCCAVVYDQVRPFLRPEGWGRIPENVWIWGWASGAAGLIGLGSWMWRSAKPIGTIPSALLALLSVLWAAVAVHVLVNILAVYHYGVLHHRCPWCLLLPEHWAVGYPLFGALSVVALEGPAVLIAARVPKRVPGLSEAAHHRMRRAGRRILLAVIVFLCLSALPALIWRWRFGVWISG